MSELRNVVTLNDTHGVTHERGIMLPAGVEWHIVTNTRTRRVTSTSVGAVAFNEFRTQVAQNRAAASAAPVAHAHIPEPKPQPAPRPKPVKTMVSPLAAQDRARGTSARVSVNTMPTAAQARVMRRALDLQAAAGVTWATIYRGRPLAGRAFATLSTLRSMAASGWLKLDDPILTIFGQMTDAGRKALARYEEIHGVAR